jgi:hypothetical protein
MPIRRPLPPIAILLLVMALGGCQTLGGARLVTSTVTTDLTPVMANIIADDMAGHLAEQIGPGDTTIALRLDGTAFGKAFEASLKGQGYAIVTDQETGNAAVVPLAYVVDAFESSVLVRISTPAVELTRMYKVLATGAEPVSPLSVMARSGEGVQ